MDPLPIFLCNRCKPPKSKEVGLTSLRPIVQEKPPRGPHQGFLSGDPVIYPYREREKSEEIDFLGNGLYRIGIVFPLKVGYRRNISLFLCPPMPCRKTRFAVHQYDMPTWEQHQISPELRWRDSSEVVQLRM